MIFHKQKVKNSNKESVAKHFEAVKKALERTARDYKFEYKDIENNVQVDKENKVITIKDGQTINEVINTLVREVGKVLLETRKYTGLSVEDEPEIDEIEKNMVVYRILYEISDRTRARAYKNIDSIRHETGSETFPVCSRGGKWRYRGIFFV